MSYSSSNCSMQYTHQLIHCGANFTLDGSPNNNNNNNKPSPTAPGRHWLKPKESTPKSLPPKLITPKSSKNNNKLKPKESTPKSVKINHKFKGKAKRSRACLSGFVDYIETKDNFDGHWIAVMLDTAFKNDDTPRYDPKVMKNPTFIKEYLGGQIYSRDARVVANLWPQYLELRDWKKYMIYLKKNGKSYYP